MNIAFVDVETTGYDPHDHRVIEIGIVTLDEDGRVQRYGKLVNPGIEVSYMITKITGITNGDIEHADSFQQVAQDVYDLLDGRLFVAHNVGFDYSFVKTELQRTGFTLKTHTLCTVKLSKRLYPQFRQHKLDALIERYNFSYTSRHRALDDANVLYQFYRHLLEDIPPSQVSKAMQSLITLDNARRYDELSETCNTTKELLQKQLSIDEIARIRNLSKSTIISHIEKIKRNEKHFDISYLQPPSDLLEGVAHARKIARGVQEIKQVMGEAISYDIIRLCLLFLR